MPAKKPDRSIDTKERILCTARALFQQRGYYAVGTAEILAEAYAPKGSMYHHFPQGKEQIAIEAVDAIRHELATLIQQLASARLSVSETVSQLARGMARWLKSSQWQQCTVLASMTIGAVPQLPQLHAALRAALAEWRMQLVRLLVAEGWSRPTARAMSDTIICAFEGAAILARIDQNERVLLYMADTLASVISKGDERGRSAAALPSARRRRSKRSTRL